MKVAYKGYSAIIYNKSQILVRMITTKDREVVKVIHNNETNYMTVFRDAILILSCTEKEKGIEYVADFVYEQGGETVVEDSKGFRDTSSAAYRLFVMKRKMMLYFHGITVREV